MSDANPLEQEVLLKAGPMKEHLGWSETTLRRRMSDPILPFPEPIRLGGTTRLWRLHEVEAWKTKKVEVSER